MSIAAQWSLDGTVDSALSVSRGLIRAATSDNIQPLALLACEKFGGTIAMCHETCRKIETSVLPTEKPATIQFLQGIVGYSRNDCALHLGTTTSGLQFLGLAAALVTTMGTFESATSLSLMLRNAAADKSLLPTTKQLRDLLSALDARLSRSRYPDQVLGWRKYLYQHPDAPDASKKVLRRASTHPSTEAIENLVDAFRRLHRIGESTVSKITVHATSSAPWVISFTRWCLGAPPSIYLGDGTPLLEQAELKVDIIVNTEYTGHDQSFLVTIHHNIGDPETLIAAGNGKRWGGMTTIENYGQWILNEYSLDQVEAFRALQQCLPYAAKEFLDKGRFTSRKAHPQVITKNSRSRDSKVIEELHTVPFGTDSSVADILSRMLNGEKKETTTNTSLELKKLDPGVRLTDLPLLKLHLKSLRNDCSCQACASGPSFLSWKGSCLKDQFLYNAALFLSDALALSLFHLSDNLLVLIDSRRDDRRQDYHTSVYSIFTHQAVGYNTSVDLVDACKIESLIDWALTLVGHDVGTQLSTSSWAMSCFKGQAVYPTIFDTYRVKQRGYLALSWQPGILQFNGEKYEIVSSEKRSFQPPPPSAGNLLSKEVLRPLNFYPNCKLKWRVEVRDGFLNLGIYLEGFSVEIIRNPLEAICGLSCSLVADSCSHNRDANLGNADRFCAYTSPLAPGEDHRDKTSVVAVDGANDLRFYSLSNAGTDPIPAVVRVNACLECSLDVCRKVGSDILVL
ncbi:uncharacterized protein TRIVIDRAFT_205508 [Trichoderma virens Gv29-8]|uniref:Uncharacterized protein n=1 Tax=Hypocrea virens (strain Gv29-8 / FGSC 10586) TaxID=413071 RepID=G9N6M1_HYPVG|nr:uncharacterized protein TRIVIDRAFT_205508 [Trichoderma virens Gv29-8]EHK17781.1 hypothetical protein TRIVIDRAFT_205508 [Trichoderma virens Gv29-8]UKZ53507.1 hypothetical protein TrVGV298_007299 [Trichoderma virens]